MTLQSQVQAALDDLIASGRETGLQVAIYRHGKLIVDAWAGLADRASGRLVDGDTLFCGFSASKGLTSTLVHALVERDLLSYDAPIAQYWPAFAANGKARINLRQVLTHSAGIPHLPPDTLPAHLADWARLCAWVEQATPLWEPGSATGYHALTWGWILGELVQRVTGQSFAQVMHDLIIQPLGLQGQIFFGDNPYFGSFAQAQTRIAVLENDPPPKMKLKPDALIFRATPLSLFPLSKTHNRADVQRACLPASGGLMTARALAKHYAALIGAGVDGVRLLSENIMAQALTLQTDANDLVLNVPYRKALGYYLGTPHSEMSATLSTFGHPGAGGTLGWADPQQGLAFALCKTRLTYARPGQTAADGVEEVVRRGA